MLTQDLERLAARGDHAHVRRGAEDVVSKLGDRSEEVFAVVQKQQQLPVLKVGDQDVQRLCGGLVSEVEGRHHRIGDERWIADLSEFDNPGAVRESPSEGRCRPKCEAGLPDTSRTHEADQAGGRKLIPDLTELTPAADKAGHLSREIAQPPARPSQPGAA